MPPKFMAWKDEVRAFMADTYDPEPLGPWVRLEVELRYPSIPWGADLDNLLGGLCDALQPPQGEDYSPGILWMDDKQMSRKVIEWVPSWDNVVVLRAEGVPEPVVPPKPKKARGKK